MTATEDIRDIFSILHDGGISAWTGDRNLLTLTVELRTQNNTTPKNNSASVVPIAFNNQPEKTKTASYMNAEISPNPNNGRFILQLKEVEATGINEVFIYNAIGQMIYQSTLSNNQTAIDLSAQPKGIYFVKVQSNSKVFSNKVIVQ